MPCNVAVVGTGRMGKLHARVLSEMQAANLACVVDVSAAAATAVGRQRGCPALTDPGEAVELADAAIIAVPTVHHLDAARPFLEAGKPVLIEKPLAPTVEIGQRLLAIADEHGASVQVGQTERFNPAVVALREFDIQPKFIEAHRISPFTFRSADVGVVLDMMIHDLDLVLMMIDGRPAHIHAVAVSVLGRPEDICNARILFDSGAVANVTASRLAIKTERKMRIFSEQAYLSVDYGKKVGIAVRKSENLDLLKMARDLDVEDLAEMAQSVDYTEMVKVEELCVDDSVEPLRRQAEAFRATVEDGAPPVVSGADGLAAVRLAEQIVAAAAQHNWDGAPEGAAGLDVRP